ncbi:hypothetical protein BGZ94_004459 [Podila epigama]|nr:hypothetical protein BGZ94_004459 [Podila epigama]
MRTHWRIKPYSCPECHRNFVRQDALTRHLRLDFGHNRCSGYPGPPSGPGKTSNDDSPSNSGSESAPVSPVANKKKKPFTLAPPAPASPTSPTSPTSPSNTSTTTGHIMASSPTSVDVSSTGGFRENKERGHLPASSISTTIATTTAATTTTTTTTTATITATTATSSSRPNNETYPHYRDALDSPRPGVDSSRFHGPNSNPSTVSAPMGFSHRPMPEHGAVSPKDAKEVILGQPPHGRSFSHSGYPRNAQLQRQHVPSAPPTTMSNPVPLTPTSMTFSNNGQPDVDRDGRSSVGTPRYATVSAWTVQPRPDSGSETSQHAEQAVGPFQHPPKHHQSHPPPQPPQQQQQQHQHQHSQKQVQSSAQSSQQQKGPLHSYHDTRYEPSIEDSRPPLQQAPASSDPRRSSPTKYPSEWSQDQPEPGQKAWTSWEQQQQKQQQYDQDARHRNPSWPSAPGHQSHHSPGYRPPAPPSRSSTLDSWSRSHPYASYETREEFIGREPRDREDAPRLVHRQSNPYPGQMNGGGMASAHENKPEVYSRPPLSTLTRNSDQYHHRASTDGMGESRHVASDEIDHPQSPSGPWSDHRSRSFHGLETVSESRARRYDDYRPLSPVHPRDGPLLGRHSPRDAPPPPFPERSQSYGMVGVERAYPTANGYGHDVPPRSLSRHGADPKIAIRERRLSMSPEPSSRPSPRNLDGSARFTFADSQEAPHEREGFGYVGGASSYQSFPSQRVKGHGLHEKGDGPDGRGRFRGPDEQHTSGHSNHPEQEWSPGGQSPLTHRPYSQHTTQPSTGHQHHGQPSPHERYGPPLRERVSVDVISAPPTGPKRSLSISTMTQ